MNLFQLIYTQVKKIPSGKVATYGQIADQVRFKHHQNISPQLVGWALHANRQGSGVPCHRVVNREGKLAKNFAFNGWKIQEQLLKSEGVTFIAPNQVDLSRHLQEGSFAF